MHRCTDILCANTAALSVQVININNSQLTRSFCLPAVTFRVLRQQSGADDSGQGKCCSCRTRNLSAGIIWPFCGQIITHSSGRGRERDTAARRTANSWKFAPPLPPAPLAPPAPAGAAAAAAEALRNQAAAGLRRTELCSLIRLRGRRGRHSCAKFF